MRSIQSPLAVDRERADTFRIRHEHGRLVVLIDLEHRIVVFLRDKNIAVLIRNDAVRAVAGLLPDLRPLYAAGYHAGNCSDGCLARPSLRCWTAAAAASSCNLLSCRPALGRFV